MEGSSGPVAKASSAAGAKKSAAADAPQPGVPRVAQSSDRAAIRATAAAYTDPDLRTLDAVHLATAENLVAAGKRVTAFVTYDKRLASTAVDAGFEVVSPGA